MKKSVIFIIIVTFILSIFAISFYGGAVRDDQFKEYYDHVLFTDVESIEIPDMDPIKIQTIEFNDLNLLISQFFKSKEFNLEQPLKILLNKLVNSISIFSLLFNPFNLIFWYEHSQNSTIKRLFTNRCR